MLMPGRNSWGSLAIPLVEVWFGFLFQPKLNPAPLSLLFRHSLRMPSKGKRSRLSTGVEIGNKFHVLALEGANAVFGRDVGRETRRRPQPLVPFSLQSVSELVLPALCWVSQGLGGTYGDLRGPVGPAPRSAQAAGARTLLKCSCHVGGDRARLDPNEVL